MKLDLTIVRIIKEVAEETGLDVKVVTTIVKSQFRFLKLKMKENLVKESNPTIIFNYLGKFKVKPGRAKALNSEREAKAKRVIDYATGKTNAY